jgi:hypothetical protein
MDRNPVGFGTWFLSQADNQQQGVDPYDEMDGVGEGVNDDDCAYEAVGVATAACVQAEVMMVTVCALTVAARVKEEEDPLLEGMIKEKEVGIHCCDRPSAAGAVAAEPPPRKEARQD